MYYKMNDPLREHNTKIKFTHLKNLKVLFSPENRLI